MKEKTRQQSSSEEPIIGAKKSAMGPEPPARFSLLHLGHSMKLLLRQLLEQRLGILEVGGVEALGEPVVDFTEHRARLVAAALLREQPREARGRAQFP